MLADKEMPSGANTLAFDKADLNKGVYFMKVETSKGTFGHKVLIDYSLKTYFLKTNNIGRVGCKPIE